MNHPELRQNGSPAGHRAAWLWDLDVLKQVRSQSPFSYMYRRTGMRQRHMKRRKRKKAHIPGILTQVTSLFGKWNSRINHQTKREPSSGRTEGHGTDTPYGPGRTGGRDSRDRRTCVLIQVRTEQPRSSSRHP